MKVDSCVRLQDKITFGSDDASLPCERILREWREMRYKDEVMEKKNYAWQCTAGVGALTHS